MKQCYFASTTAYLYHSQSTVYSMQLTNFTDAQYDTPRFFIFAYSLPGSLQKDFIQLNTEDIVTIIVLLAAIVMAFRWFVINRVLLKVRVCLYLSVLTIHSLTLCICGCRWMDRSICVALYICVCVYTCVCAAADP